MEAGSHGDRVRGDDHSARGKYKGCFFYSVVFFLYLSHFCNLFDLNPLFGLSRVKERVP